MSVQDKVSGIIYALSILVFFIVISIGAMPVWLGLVGIICCGMDINTLLKRNNMSIYDVYTSIKEHINDCCEDEEVEDEEE